MRYLSKLQLGLEVARLYQKYPPFMKKWPWLADGAPGVPDFLASLKEMCWMIYQRTNTDGGAQIMGREWDTDPFAMDANIMGRVLAAAQGDSLQGSSKKGVQEFQKNWGVNWEKQKPAAPGQSVKWQERTQAPAAPGFNYSPGARGNVLKMDRWHPTMNDCWVLGGVHRNAQFKLVSPRIPDNIWNVSQGFPIVTAREMLGLLRYGYRIERRGAEVMFIPGPPVGNSNITDYWDYITEVCRDKNAVNVLIHKLLDLEVKKGLHAELKNFDRSTLRKVS